jgi:ketosteroid isomerase-like protein
VSAESVELIRSVFPGPEVDLVELFADDAAFGQWAEALGPLLDPGFMTVAHMPGAEPATAEGLRGLRAGWLDWLAPWASYRTEIEELIDLEERVVVVICDYARREPDGPEVRLRAAVIWTLRGGLIARIDFYPGGRAEALASVGLAE